MATKRRYRPLGENAATLNLMDRIDKLYMDYPFYGSRQMVREGVAVGRHRPPGPNGRTAAASERQANGLLKFPETLMRFILEEVYRETRRRTSNSRAPSGRRSDRRHVPILCTITIDYCSHNSPRKHTAAFTAKHGASVAFWNVELTPTVGATIA